MTDKKQGDTYQSDIIFMNENDPFQIKHRKRTSKKQLEVLEKTFETCIRPDAKLRKKLGDQLGMTPRAVQIWFQNRRAKVKKAQGTVSKRKTEPREDYYSKEEDSTPSPCTYRYPKRYPKKIYSEDTTGSSNYSVVEGSQVKNNYKFDNENYNNEFDNENYKEFDNEYLNTNNTGNTTDTMEVYKENFNNYNPPIEVYDTSELYKNYESSKYDCYPQQSIQYSPYPTYSYPHTEFAYPPNPSGDFLPYEDYYHKHHDEYYHNMYIDSNGCYKGSYENNIGYPPQYVDRQFYKDYYYKQFYPPQEDPKKEDK